MIQYIKITACYLLLSIGIANSAAADSQPDIEALKAQILDLAKSYEGQGDPDQSKQRSLEVLVNQLRAAAPMPPVAERLQLLDGTWKQVWGPYDYRNEDGGVDPTIGVTEIYQVVSADGYYYNVSPRYPNAPDKTREQVSLLRGEFQLHRTELNSLRVRFTNYPGVEPRPADTNIWELAPLAEAGELENQITIVPRLIVRLFFGGGTLEEVYTDHDMRLVYGTSNKRNARKSLYVMTRID